MKKKLIIIVVALAVVLAAVVSFICYQNYLQKTYVTIAGEQYLRSVDSLQVTVSSEEDLQQLAELQALKELDLRSSQLTTAQFDTLQSALPACDILWKVPFQGGSVSSDTTKLNISTLTEEDIDLLRYFPDLTNVSARGCTDYDQLLLLAQRYPELEVYYTINLGGQFWPNSSTEVSISLEEVETALQYLPMVEAVTLTESPADVQAVVALQETYPDVTFSYQLEVCGVIVENTAEQIDLSGIAMTDTSELESMLKYLPNLTKVDMCNCGISNEDMEALNNRHEDILFVWLVEIKGMEFRTDITEMMPVKYDLWVNDEDCYNLRYFTELIALDLGHMFIYNCDFVQYMPHLKYLILADTDVSDLSPLTGLEELIFLEVFMCPIRDYSPLVTLTALEDLNICYTYGDPDVIAQMTWLDRLWWGQVQSSRISDSQRQALREALPNTEIEYEPHSSTGAGWREGQNYFDMRDIFGMHYMTK